MVTAIRDAVLSPPHTLGFRPLKKTLFPPCVGVGASLPPQAAAAPAVPADHTAPPVQAGPQPGPPRRPLSLSLSGAHGEVVYTVLLAKVKVVAKMIISLPPSPVIPGIQDLLKIKF